MDKTRRAELLADMAEEKERMFRMMAMIRDRGRGPSMVDVEDFRNVATDAMDSFLALDVAVTAHERMCGSDPDTFVSPTWEPCSTLTRFPDAPVSAWDCRMNGDLWTLEYVNHTWRLWGPVTEERVGVRDLARGDVVARHIAHQQIKDFYETGKR